MSARSHRSVALVSAAAWALLAGCSSNLVFSEAGSGSGGDGAGAAGGAVTSSGTAGSGGVGASGGSGGNGGAGAAGGAGGGQPGCGDGVINGMEECDSASLGSNCQGLGFDGGSLICSPECTYDTSGCYLCGDGIVNGMEVCDGPDLAGNTCQSLGFDGGNLSCDMSCNLNTSACTISEICDNNVDDDNDNLTDCADPDCIASPSCGPVEAISGCDPKLCTFAAGGGPNGGDLCTCTIPQGRHPIGDDLSGNLCGLFNNGRDLTLQFSTAGYASFSVSTCEVSPGDSSIAAFNGNPAGMAPMIACNGDAGGETGFCSELTNSGNGGPPLLTPLSPGTNLWIQVDEWSEGNYWNNVTPRVIQVELHN